MWLVRLFSRLVILIHIRLRNGNLELVSIHISNAAIYRDYLVVLPYDSESEHRESDP